MRYVISRFEETQREYAYRLYVADSLNLQAQGKYITKRYSEFITPTPIDNRNGDEIAEDIITRAGLVIK